MTNFILADNLENTNHWQQLLPLTFTRPIAHLRIGIDKIYEKWNFFLQKKVSFLTQNYLQTKFELHLASQQNTCILANIIPNKALARAILNLSAQQKLIDTHHKLIAICFEGKQMPSTFTHFETLVFDAPILQINHIWDIFQQNKIVLEQDFDRITHARTSQKLSASNTLIGDANQLFIEKDALVEAAILNVQEGKIYIAAHAQVQEGAMLRGAIALGQHATIKMGAKVYGATTIGEHSKIGGEVSNIVVQGFSNKAHDGYLGNALLGEWCNLGADTNASNLKNNYQNIDIWNYSSETYCNSGLQFCGLIMGDHSKCAINTMFNTATVVGVCANIYGAGFPKKFVPSFTWGGIDDNYEYKLYKAMETASLVMQRRNLELTEADKFILQHIFEYTKKFRKK